MKLHAPLLPLAICLMVGIFLGGFLGDWTQGLALLVTLLLVTTLLRRYPRCQTMGICCCALVLGMLLSAQRSSRLQVDWPDSPVVVEGIVASEPVQKEQFVTFDLLTTHHQKLRCRMANDDNSQRIALGHGLQIHAQVRRTHEWKSGHFDYQRYMLCHSFSGELFVRRGCWQWSNTPWSALSVVQRTRLQALLVRHQLLENYRQWGITDEVYHIAAAMTLGEKSQLDRQLKETYSQVGVSHILALSGLHLMIIYSVITLFVGWRRFRTVSQVLIVLAVWAFAFLAGLSPSVVRSALMISVYALLSLGFRERMSVNVLAFTAIVMLLVNPFALYDIGFQLSFAAVLAILLCNPLFARLIPLHVLQQHRWLNMVWGLTTVSLSAQVGTAPLVVYYFGRFSTYFLLGNYLVIPLATAILYLTLVCVATCWWTALQHVAVVCLSFVITTMNRLLAAIALLPKSSVDDLHLSTLQLFFVYVLLGGLYTLLYIYVRRKDVENLTKV